MNWRTSRFCRERTKLSLLTSAESLTGLQQPGEGSIFHKGATNPLKVQYHCPEWRLTMEAELQNTDLAGVAFPFICTRLCCRWVVVVNDFRKIRGPLHWSPTLVHSAAVCNPVSEREISCMMRQEFISEPAPALNHVVPTLSACCCPWLTEVIILKIENLSSCLSATDVLPYLTSDQPLKTLLSEPLLSPFLALTLFPFLFPFPSAKDCLYHLLSSFGNI